MKGLENNKSIFVEKPICLYPEELQKIRDLANSMPHLSISSNLPCEPAERFTQLKKEISPVILEIFILFVEIIFGGDLLKSKMDGEPNGFLLNHLRSGNTHD